MPLRIYAAIVTGQLAYRQSPDIDALDGLDNARQRMEILEPVVKDAYRVIKEHESKNPPPTKVGVQRLFLAPEYYFSRQRFKDSRFFSETVRTWVLLRLRSLAKLCPDMLIVPGTVLWSSPAVTSPTLVQKQALQKGASEKDAFRQAVLIAELKNKPRIQAMTDSLSKGQLGNEYSKRGEAGKKALVEYDEPDGPKGAKAQYLDPRYLFGLRAIPLDVAFNSAYVLFGSKVLEYNKTGNYEEVKGEAAPLVFFSGGVKGIFKLGGIRYGLEICMDHATDVLADPTNPSRKPVDVHLIVSSFVDFRGSDATVIFHSSTQKPGLYKSADGNIQDAQTQPVRAQSTVTLAAQLASKECTISVVDVPNLNASGSELEGVTVHAPDALAA